MQLIVATNNPGKLREFRRILEPLGIQVLSQKEAGVQVDPEENGETFAQNAYIKAKAVYDIAGLPCVADDSGLCIDALDGRPGVLSARYYGHDTPYSEKMQHLLDEMKDVADPQRTARFVSHITCILDEDTVLECEGTCEGMIGHQPAGENGFGYDPLFYVDGRSYGELSAEEKDRISHRGKALRLLYDKLKEQLGR